MTKTYYSLSSNKSLNGRENLYLPYFIQYSDKKARLQKDKLVIIKYLNYSIS